MEEIERKYHSTRAIKGVADSYQEVTVTRDTGHPRGYITVEVGYMQRWRSVKEAVDYLRWAANEIEKLEKKFYGKDGIKK